MATKRKDNKGRVLKTGESQRKDGLYQYRYTDVRGKRRTIYRADLSALREEVQKIERSLTDGIDVYDSQMTLYELVENYCHLKSRSVKPNTLIIYERVLKRLSSDPFAKRPIKDIKMSQAKAWFALLAEDNLGKSSLRQIRGIIKPAFETAIQDDLLYKNPFAFDLGYLGLTSTVREALPPDVLYPFLEFVKQDRYSSKYFDVYIILLGTGLRIGELCGLTFRDVDMKSRRITVSHQLNRKKGGGVYILNPKSKAGNRIIPMTDEVYAAFSRVIANRPKLKVEPFVDGYSGFLFVSPSGAIQINTYISKAIWNAIRKYNNIHQDCPLPTFSPHNLRHTFCTNLFEAGVDVKTVQYLMGHSSASITLDVYTHTTYQKAEKAFLNATAGVNLTTPLLHHLSADL